jgi:hypothetical protein
MGACARSCHSGKDRTREVVAGTWPASELRGDFAAGPRADSPPAARQAAAGPTPWNEPREGYIDVGGEHELLLRRQRRGIGQHVGERRRRPVVPHCRCASEATRCAASGPARRAAHRLIALSISRGSHRQEPRAGRHRRASALGSPNSHAHVAGGSARQRRCALVRLHEPEPLVDSARHLRQDVGAVGVVQLRHGGDSASRRPGEAG